MLTGRTNLTSFHKHMKIHQIKNKLVFIKNTSINFMTFLLIKFEKKSAFIIKGGATHNNKDDPGDP